MLPACCTRLCPLLAKKSATKPSPELRRRGMGEVLSTGGRADGRQTKNRGGVSTLLRPPWVSYVEGGYRGHEELPPRFP